MTDVSHVNPMYADSTPFSDCGTIRHPYGFNS